MDISRFVQIINVPGVTAHQPYRTDCVFVRTVGGDGDFVMHFISAAVISEIPEPYGRAISATALLNEALVRERLR